MVYMIVFLYATVVLMTEVVRKLVKALVTQGQPEKLVKI